jgi:hypothetical protein
MSFFNFRDLKMIFINYLQKFLSQKYLKKDFGLLNSFIKIKYFKKLISLGLTRFLNFKKNNFE